MHATQPGADSHLANRYDKRVYNSSGQTIPPFSIVKVSTSNPPGQDDLQFVTVPTGSGSEKYLLTGPQELLPNRETVATDTYPAEVRYDSAGGAPAGGSLWGPFGGFSLSVNGTGFLILSAPANGRVRVAEVPASSSASADYPLFYVRNLSGLARPTRTIFGLTTPFINPPTNLSIMSQWNSAPPNAGQFFCISLDNVAVNDFVLCAPVGVLAVQLDYRGTEYLNDAQLHGFADASESNYAHLKSSQDGPARILWRERQAVIGSGTQGVQWAFVNLDHQGVVDAPRGVVFEEITAATGNRGGPLTPGNGRATLYRSTGGNAGAVCVVVGNVDVENWFRGAIPVGKPVGLRPCRRLPNGHLLYEVSAEGCAEVPVAP